MLECPPKSGSIKNTFDQIREKSYSMIYEVQQTQVKKQTNKNITRFQVEELTQTTEMFDISA